MNSVKIIFRNTNIFHKIVLAKRINDEDNNDTVDELYFTELYFTKLFLFHQYFISSVVKRVSIHDTAAA